MLHYWFYDEDHKPYPSPPFNELTVEQMVAWSQWFEKHQRVKETTISPYWVSTVFLGIDHQSSQNETPVLWETMVTKSGEFLNYQRRYMSHDDAVFGHNKIVELLSNPFTLKEIDPDE